MSERVMADEKVVPTFEQLKKRLDVAIAFKDAERGRPLTDAEKLENLRRWLKEED